MSRSRLSLGLLALVILAALSLRLALGGRTDGRAASPSEIPGGGLPSERRQLSEVAETTAPQQARVRIASALHGRVRSANGESLSGARVTWLALQQEDGEKEPAWPDPDWGVADRSSVETTSDLDGLFSFETDPASDLKFGSALFALHPGHFPAGIDLPIHRSDWPGDIEIRLESATAIAVEVVDDSGLPRSEARIRHVTRPPDPGEAGRPAYERFLAEESVSDSHGRALLTAFRGEQALWAESGDLVSVPWRGTHPHDVVLVLVDSFTLAGTLTLPQWDARFEGERRIVVTGLAGNLWRPLARLRDVHEGAWGPVRIPLASFMRYTVRLEGAPVAPIEETFDRPCRNEYRLIDFAAERLADLWLQVHDDSERPVSNAIAEVWWSDTERGAGHVEGAARPDGVIWVGTFPPGWVRYRVSAPGFAFFEHEVQVPAPEGLSITLHKGGVVAGRCVHDGKPVPDFQVIFWQEGAVRNERSRTFLGQEDGTFVLDGLVPSDWSFLAASPSFPSSRPATVHVDAGHETRVELHLPDGILGGGRIIDAESGAPVPDARIQPYSSGGLQRSLPWGPPAISSPDGTFEIKAFVPGSNYITVEADHYAQLEAEATATNSESLDWGDLRLSRPQALRLTLVGLDRIPGIEGPDLRIQGESGPLLQERRFSIDGDVRYEGVSPGEHRVFITYPDNTWTRLHLRLDPGKDWVFDHKVGGESVLSVHVVDQAGKTLPFVAAVMVTAQEATGVFVVRLKGTTRDGHVQFEGIRASQVQVSIFKPSNELIATRDYRFSSIAGGNMEIRLGDKPFRVRVLDASGDALSGAWVTIRSLSGTDILCVDDTDSDGWAELFGLPGGDVLMDVTHGIAGKRFGVPIDASAGELEFTLEATGTLELELADGDVPLAGVLTSMETTGGVALSDVKQTDDRGLVRFDPLGEGTYHLGCRRADCWPTVVDRALGADEHARVNVQMRRLCDLELTVTNREGLPVSGFPIELRSSEFGVSVADWLADERVRAPHGLVTDLRGTIRVQGLPRGEYSWSAPVEGQSLTGSIKLDAGKINEARVILP